MTQENKILKESVELMKQMQGKTLSEAKKILRTTESLLDQTHLVDAESEAFNKIIKTQVDPQNLLLLS